jgi:hypothetical protein
MTAKRKNSQVTSRLPDGLLERLDKACDVTGLDTSTVVKACLTAFVEEVEATGEIRLPLAIVPKVKKSSIRPEGSPTASGSKGSSASTARHKFEVHEENQAPGLGGLGADRGRTHFPTSSE